MIGSSGIHVNIRLSFLRFCFEQLLKFIDGQMILILIYKSGQGLYRLLSFNSSSALIAVTYDQESRCDLQQDASRISQCNHLARLSLLGWPDYSRVSESCPAWRK